MNARHIAPLTLFCLALGLTLHKSESRGAMWPDSPRYANAGAMIHDWFKSGELKHPMSFAERNYFQYPAFNIPFHPPGYPTILGLLFLVGGVSYLTAKVFVAFCWAGSVLFFYFLHLRFGFAVWRSWLLSLVFLSTPQLLHWSRDTMSEIPALFFLIASTFLYVMWLDSSRTRYLWLAFLFIGMSFQCRITVVGVFPAWSLYAIFTSRFRNLYRSPTFVSLSLVCVSMVALWVKWVSGYAQYEVNADGRAGGVSWQHLRFFVDLARDFFFDGNGIMLVASLIFLGAFRKLDLATKFWLAWLLASVAFKILVPTTSEVRHFLFALPAFAGLGSCWLPQERTSFREHGILLCILLFVFNGGRIRLLPNGLIGYDPLAQLLSQSRECGNIFLSCPHDQELIFRYRSHVPVSDRLMIRSDRTISTRVAEYAQREAAHHVTEPHEVLEIFRKGRIRFAVVTLDNRDAQLHFDWKISAQTIRTYPDLFEELGRFPLRVEFQKPGYELLVGVYRFNEELRDGPSELRLQIPTAGMEIAPK